jgi:carboxyl-terminal processing protease
MGKAGNKKILLDLRDVSVGDMAEGVRMANFFLKSGTIATLEGQKFPKQTFTADAAKSINSTAPVVVLVNRGTSGPAELIAAAIADNKRGELVGEKTFGEGSQQKTFELPDGAAVILSIAKYASPAGKKFEDEAVTPAVLVASNLDEDAIDDDSAQGKAAAANRKSSVQVDDQLSKAIDLLKAKPA